MKRPGLAIVFLSFLKLGTTAFGGPAMIPYIRREAVERRGWLSDRSFAFGVSITQMIPGATAMQMAAYAGMRARGALGALVAYAGFSLPAFLLMLGLSFLYFEARDMAWVESMFMGLQVAVTALILNAAVDFSRRYLDDLRSRLLALLAGVWVAFRGNPILALVVVCTLAVFLFRQEQDTVAEECDQSLHANHLGAACVIVGIALGSAAALWFFNPQLFDLAALMAKIDLFAFGGGYVSVPLMLHEVVEARSWLTEPQFMDGIALGQITPGPIVMTATFVGYYVRGLAGAFVATVAVFTPSIVILLGSTAVYGRLACSGLARRVLRGSLVSLVGLMAAVGGRFFMSSHWNIGTIILFSLSFLALRLRVGVIPVVLFSALISLAFSL